jgi:hypothetical protein
LLLRTEHRSGSDYSEARIRLVLAFLFQLLRETGNSDVKILAFSAAARTVGASEEDQVWLAEAVQKVGSNWDDLLPGFFSK